MRAGEGSETSERLLSLSSSVLLPSHRYTSADYVASLILTAHRLLYCSPRTHFLADLSAPTSARKLVSPSLLVVSRRPLRLEVQLISRCPSAASQRHRRLLSRFQSALLLADQFMLSQSTSGSPRNILQDCLHPLQRSSAHGSRRKFISEGSSAPSLSLTSCIANSLAVPVGL